MTGLRLATIASVLLLAAMQTPIASAQVIITTGEGVCPQCGHSELDTQRYVNSFLNQLFFPPSAPRRAGIAASLYLLTATFTVHGRQSPDPQFASVTIAITAEVKNALPTGLYHVTFTTPGGDTKTKTYAIGSRRFSVRGEYAPGARRTKRLGIGNSGRPRPPGHSSSGPGPGPDPRRPARCSRARLEARGNETIAWCSAD